MSSSSSAAASSSETHGGYSAAAGRWLVLAATVMWGTTATLARFVFRDHHVPALTVVELRLLIAVAVLGPWLALRHPEKLHVRREDWGYLLVLGLLGVTTVQGSYYYSISKLGVGLSILIQYLAPSLIVIYEALRGRPARLPVFAAVFGALAGTALLVGGVDRAALAASPLDWVVGFTTCVSFAFYILYSKRGLRRYPPETIIFYTFSFAALVWAAVTPPWRIVAAGYDARLWGMFGVLGVFSTLVPFACFYAGLRRLPAAQTGVLATLEPVVAVLSAAFFLHEGLRPLQWLGAGLVLAASAVAARQQTGG